MTAQAGVGETRMAVVARPGQNMVVQPKSSRNHRGDAAREDLTHLPSERRGEHLPGRHTLRKFRSGAVRLWEGEYRLLESGHRCAKL